MKDFVFAGVDVSAATFDASLLAPGRQVPDRRQFDNTPKGRQSFLQWLLEKSQCGARVCLESTGVYSLDLSVLLHDSEDVEVMVVNPRVMSNFREAISGRNKTDRDDAQLALSYLRSMAFVPWLAPAQECLELRQMARRIHDLVAARTQEKDRKHAAKATSQLSDWLIRDIELHIRQINEHIEQLRKEALKLIRRSDLLRRRYQLLLTVKGIARVSAIQILGELAVLPEGMAAKQWVAWAGLDPIHFESGTSVHKPPRISRRGNVHLRRALYMPAWTAVQWDPHVRYFFRQLLNRGKKPLQAYTAVMRKLLHAIYGMFKHDVAYDSSKFRAMPPAEEEHSRPQSSLLVMAGNPDEAVTTFQAGEAAEGLAWKVGAASLRMAAKGSKRGKSAPARRIRA